MRPRTAGGWYELAVGAALTAMVLYAVAASGVPEILAGARDRGHSPGWVAVSLLCFVVGAWIAGWHFAGPLAVPAARLHWLVWRQHPAQLLRSAAAQVLLVSMALATLVAVVAGLALAAVGLPAVGPSVAVWLTLELLVVATMYLQRRDLDGPARWAAFAAGAAGVSVAAGEAWGPAGVVAAGAVAGIVVTAALVAAIRRGATARRGRAAELTPRWQLYRGARHRWAVSAGFTLMEGEVVRLVRQRDQTTRRRPIPAAAYRWPRPLGLSAVVLLRSTRPVAAIGVLAVPLAFAANEILGSTPAVTVLVLTQFALVMTTARAAETWLTSEALPRIWGAGAHETSAALAAPCVAAGLVLAATAVIGFSLPPAAGAVLAALPVAILLRRRSARRPAAGLTLISTPMGAVSVQSVNKVIAGPDVALLAVLVADGLG
ncbi:hypothetical protein [Jiangella gansuensis]|uniref:hypothetical protein n=1 Tax=Jiangella gansuensis TaxID=281473 RepID=UPI00047EEFB5|nr:hypothetical protein [Jiangella gansuensis]